MLRMYWPEENGSSSEGALVGGPKGGIIARNSSNCGYLHGDAAVEGVRLSPPAPGGIEIRLTDYLTD
jgi:hypothetical protein